MALALRQAGGIATDGDRIAQVSEHGDAVQLAGSHQRVGKRRPVAAGVACPMRSQVMAHLPNGMWAEPART